MKHKSTVQPGETVKWCSKCETEKPLEEFNKNKSRPDGLQNYCKPCSYEAYRASFLNKKDVDFENQRRWQKNRNLKKSYGITLEEFELMVLEQNNKCPICHTEMETPNVDQDEEGVVRALLCGDCKAGLKAFRGNTELFLRAVSYLDSYKQKGRLAGDPSVEQDADTA